MDIEIANMPSPIEGATVGNQKLQAFQENVDTMTTRAVKLPWQETPQDVKARIEGQAIEQYNQKKASNGKFAGPRVYVVGKGTVLPQAGDEVIVNNKSMRVGKVYSNGSFDAE